MRGVRDRFARWQRRVATARTRPRVIVGSVAVGAVAAAALLGARDEDPAATSAAVAVRYDPGGDAHARITLPPKRRWFGFNGNYFAWTGSHPDLDHGLTPERTVADAAAAGVNSARVLVGWWDLEPKPGQINRAYLDKMDRFVAALRRRGGRPLFVLGSTPPWAAAHPDREGSPPRTDRRTVRAFARFAAFVARRWPEAVAIETWNEPNSVLAWAPKADPEAYARLHRAAAAAIRAARPRMRVLLGGLALTLGDDRFMRASTYLRRLYQAGLRRRHYDGIAIHPYPGGGVEPLDEGAFAAGLADFRRGHRPWDRRPELWITETGVTTSGPGGTSQRGQATQVLRLVRKLLTMPRVKGVYLHTQYEFMAVSPRSPERGFGLLEPRGAEQGRPKLAFCALRRLVRRPPPFEGCP